MGPEIHLHITDEYPANAYIYISLLRIPNSNVDYENEGYSIAYK